MTAASGSSRSFPISPFEDLSETRASVGGEQDIRLVCNANLLRACGTVRIEVYFSSKLWLKGGYDFNWEKLFGASDEGVRLFAGRYSSIQFFNHFATVPYRYLGAEVKRDGAVIADLMLEDCASGCGELFGTDSRRLGPTDSVNGLLRLSPDGNYALNLHHDYSGYATLAYFDLDHLFSQSSIIQKGTAVSLGSLGRAIANMARPCSMRFAKPTS